MPQFDSQGLSTSAWSYATLVVCDPPLLEALASSAITRMSDFDATQGLANLAWSFSKLLFAHYPLWESIASASLARIGVFGMQSLSNLAWSYAAIQ